MKDRKPALLTIALLASLIAAPSASASDFDCCDGGAYGDPDGTIMVTGYVATGHRTASGVWPYVGSAACPEQMAFGQRVRLVGKVELTVVCEDRPASWLIPQRIDVYVRYSREAFAMTGQYRYWLLP